MARFRKALPQLGGDFFLTDGGIETTLVFLEGLSKAGEAALRKYFVMCSCCGTDHRHVEQIAAACSPLFQKAT
ncbi:MAG TPA: hypothetical protein VMN03_01435 [Burkholderiales bacterium]|nr:hypothetical protein [Burkholderiales bacterium]